MKSTQLSSLRGTISLPVHSEGNRITGFPMHSAHGKHTPPA